MEYQDSYTELSRIHTLCFHNRLLLKMFKTGSCFHCLQKCTYDQIDEWMDEKVGDFGLTAMCPHCHIDTVLPGDYDKHCLTIINKMFFDGKDSFCY